MNAGDLTTLDNLREWLGLSSIPIAAITKAASGVVTTMVPSGLMTGMLVGLNGIEGMTELNGQMVQVTVIDASNFSIGVDTTGYGTYTGLGYASLDDALLERLISACSTYVQNVMNRRIANTTYTESRNGQGSAIMMAKRYPITAINSLSINGLAIQPRAPFSPSGSYTGNGTTPQSYTFDDNAVYLTGMCFERGFQNVAIDYDAGFLISEEAQTIPLTAPYQCVTIARWSAGDRGVVYAADGTAFVKVTGTPSVGQYAVDESTYTFAAADAGVGVFISYAYVPFDIEQATLDMIGDWFKYKDRIGTLSKAIEQQSITFTNTPMPARTVGVINQYKETAPVQ